MGCVIIKRNSTIPTNQTKSFSTHEDFQESVTVQVYEGERPFTEDNHLLGNFGLMDIPLMRRGMLEVEVSFDVDANGILNVTASEKSSGKKEKVKITNEESRLSAEEIAKMVENAEDFKKQDEVRKIIYPKYKQNNLQEDDFKKKEDEFKAFFDPIVKKYALV